jgi:hypothetical protein
MDLESKKKSVFSKMSMTKLQGVIEVLQQPPGNQTTKQAIDNE